MDYLKLVYKILKILRDMLPLEEPDYNVISAEALGVPVPLWSSIMEDLATKGYIKGVGVRHTFDARYPKIDLIEPRITIEGLVYLEENGMMRKIKNMAKGVIDIIT